ncbi:hypothetical protein QAD02_013801 [Eretmocerus hayati]|uniref:Uncharacterized protein n=1 Tax=Eretmocerus hayati TaxID=131215 RepID=A0ACC2P3W7_9HYME|nr:hypothetical protein QAD02_013801 [Eretmocerus hayati]
MRRGRKPRLSSERIFDSIKELEFFREDEKLLKYKDMNVPLKPKRQKRKQPAPTYATEWDEDEFYDGLDCESLSEEFNSIDLIIKMTKQESLDNVFHKISVVPFIVTYWHPNQTSMWSLYSEVDSGLSLIIWKI